MKVHPVAFPIVWGAIILVMTSVPQPPSIDLSGSDKVAHFAAYLILGALCAPWIRLHSADGPKRSALALCAILLFAVLDEAHQLLIPGRMASAGDWLADAAGAAVGIALAKTLNSTTKVST